MRHLGKSRRYHVVDVDSTDAQSDDSDTGISLPEVRASEVEVPVDDDGQLDESDIAQKDDVEDLI